jgi:hypothetical protein
MLNYISCIGNLTPFTGVWGLVLMNLNEEGGMRCTFLFVFLPISTVARAVKATCRVAVTF